MGFGVLLCEQHAVPEMHSGELGNECRKDAIVVQDEKRGRQGLVCKSKICRIIPVMCIVTANSSDGPPTNLIPGQSIGSDTLETLYGGSCHFAAARALYPTSLEVTGVKRAAISNRKSTPIVSFLGSG